MITHYDYYDLITALALAEANRLLRDIDYLEIGTQEGGSALAAFESAHIGHATLIDTWGVQYGGSGRGSQQHIIELLGPERMERTVIITGDSHAVVPTLNHSFDFIFVDGDHSEAGCPADMNNCLPLLRPLGVMLVDDIDHPAHSYIRRLVDDFAKTNNLSVRYHKQHYGLAELRIS